MKYLFILIFISLPLFAFENLKIQKPSAMDDEFKTLSQALSTTRTLKANFTQSKKIKVLKKPLLSSGKLIFDRETGVFWKLEKPFESIIVIDQTKLTSIDDEGKKITFKAEEKPMLYGFTKIFLSIFSGNTEELKKHFTVYYGKSNGKWQIGLIPSSAELKKVLSKILLSGSNQTVSDIKLWESNGDLTDIHFTDIQKAQKLSADDKKKFEF